MNVLIMSALHLHGLLCYPRKASPALMKNIYIGRQMLQRSMCQAKENPNKKIRLCGKTGVADVWETAMLRNEASASESTFIASGGGGGDGSSLPMKSKAAAKSSSKKKGESETESTKITESTTPAGCMPSLSAKTNASATPKSESVTLPPPPAKVGWLANDEVAPLEHGEEPFPSSSLRSALAAARKPRQTQPRSRPSSSSARLSSSRSEKPAMSLDHWFASK